MLRESFYSIAAQAVQMSTRSPCSHLGSSVLPYSVLVYSPMARIRDRKHFLKKSQMGVFEVGQVKAHVYHGLGATAISRILTKPDGKSHYSATAIADCIERLSSEPAWTGERKKGSGPPRRTTKQQDAALVRMLFKMRGRRRVTVNYLRTCFPWAAKLGNTALEERLHEAGLTYLRRCRKTYIGAEKHLAARVAYCKRVLTLRQSTLDKWAYSDGTVFYLDRTEQEHLETMRAALGQYVWRQADRADALYADCVGPSCYRKSQGEPVRIWGLLAAGKLNVYVIEKGEIMDRYLYQELIEDYFPGWMAHSEYLVQDFERALRCDEAMLALRDIGLELVEDYPPVSQDFNAIENAWKHLRDRLNDTLPTGIERREDFVKRLLAAVAWVNKNCAEELAFLSRNQKRRARDCLAGMPPGSRTRW